MRSRNLAPRRRCVFSGSYVREQIDPVVKELFALFGYTPNWGDMRRTWDIKHCREINPYGAEDCPFTEAQCAVAFLDAVEETLRAKPKKFGALFRYVASRTGGERADEAQRSRHARRLRGGGGEGHDPSMGQPVQVVPDQPRAGHPGGDRDVVRGEAETVRGPDAGPTRIGALFGSLDLGPRPSPRRRDEGEEGTE